MLFAEQSVGDHPWLTMITQVAIALGILGTVYLQILALRKAKETAEQAKRTGLLAQTAAAAAAGEAREVKDALAGTNADTSDKLDGIAKVAKDTHTLVNSNMAVQLKLNAAVTRRLANLTKGTPEGEADQKAAELAEKLSNDHESKQRTIDAATADKGA